MMYTQEEIQEATEELRYLWEGNPNDYVLVKSHGRYSVYNIVTKSIHGSEVEEANIYAWQRMIENGTIVLDERPPSLFDEL